VSELDIIEMVGQDMGRLRGRLFSLIEAVGLPRRQELALKSCVRNVSYDAQADLEQALRREFADRRNGSGG
jgi:hypothetical protein